MSKYEKPLTMPFKICHNFCKILNNLNFNQEKLKNVQISFDRSFAKNLQFFSQILCNPFPYVKGFPKSIILSNLTSGSGSKQRFNLLQEKEVIQAVCLRTQAVSIKARF
jgi:hypothetical protein